MRCAEHPSRCPCRSLTAAAYHDHDDWLSDGVQTGHVLADSLDELEAVATKLSLLAERFRGDALTPRYQLSESLYDAVVAFGVKFLNRERISA